MTTSQDIANALEQQIVFGRLHPSQRLVEDDIMEQFGATRLNLAVNFEPYRLDLDPLRVSASVRAPLSALGWASPAGAELEASGALSSELSLANALGGGRAYLGLTVRLPF